MKNKILYYTICFITLLIFNCREPFDISTNDFESVLVVEATIINELKHQEVKLSLTSILEDNEQVLVNNAKVWIEEGSLNSYNFTQNEDGIYISDTVFKASENNSYTLNITTPNGNQYKSSETLLTPVAEITDLYAELLTYEEGTGVQVLINTNNESGLLQYYRYEYEETYKIVVPMPSLRDFELSGTRLEYEITRFPREEESQICYTTNKSTGIIQASTFGINGNSVMSFPIRFVKEDDYIIRERYSILVKQYVQSLGSYTYYKTIKELGDTQSLLSNNQSGYISGNMSAVNNLNEKVLGYFDVAAISSSRIYFNYQDFDLLQPRYFTECEAITLDYTDNLIAAYDGDKDERDYLYTLLSNGFVILFENNDVYKIVEPACGDCNSFSSNIVPDFWED